MRVGLDFEIANTVVKTATRMAEGEKLVGEEIESRHWQIVDAVDWEGLVLSSSRAAGRCG